jgi:hypothetical protein
MKSFGTFINKYSTDPSQPSTNLSSPICVTGMSFGVLITTFGRQFTALVHTSLITQSNQQHWE